MPESIKGWRSWFSKIETVQQAREVVRDSVIVFYVVAGIHAVLSFVVGAAVLFDASGYALLSFWLHKRCSRVAAVLLLLISVLAVASTAMNRLGGGGRNIFLSIIIFWAAIRAVYASFKLPALQRTEASSLVSGQGHG